MTDYLTVVEVLSIHDDQIAMAAHPAFAIRACWRLLSFAHRRAITPI
jgi:hypothetical protein